MNRSRVGNPIKGFPENLVFVQFDSRRILFRQTVVPVFSDRDIFMLDICRKTGYNITASKLYGSAALQKTVRKVRASQGKDNC